MCETPIGLSAIELHNIAINPFEDDNNRVCHHFGLAFDEPGLGSDLALTRL
jgi:hypothetical protein